MRLNEMQVIGSHNSYHVENPAISQFVIDLAYTAAPLDEQFSHQGVRQIELDVYADPAGDALAAARCARLQGVPHRTDR